MDKTENDSRLTHKIDDLRWFEIAKVRDETWSYIFEGLYDDSKKLKEFLDKFDDIYYLSVSPREIEKYKNNAVIYNILKRYEHTAEWHNLELMIFKMKELSEEQKQEALRRAMEMYPWWDIKIDETNYLFIVWYFGWTAWRTNSYYMEQIMKLYPVKSLV